MIRNERFNIIYISSLRMKTRGRSLGNNALFFGILLTTFDLYFSQRRHSVRECAGSNA